MSERAAVLLTYAVSLVIGMAFLLALAALGASDQLLGFAVLPVLAGGALSISVVTMRYGDARRKRRS